MTETLLTPDTSDNFDQNKNYFSELVGDGKKFKTPEDLAKGKAEADHFIEVLKRQQDELRADYLRLRQETEQRARLEEILGRLETQQPKSLSNPDQPLVDNVQKPVIDPKELDALVSSKFQEIEAQRKAQDNFNSVREKLKEVYGESHSAVLKSKIEELGLTEDYVNDMARRAPKALLRTLGVDQPRQQESLTAPPRSNVRSDNFKPTGGDKRTWAWYQRLKDSDPKRYFDPKTNVQMHNDMIALGEEFKDGDYKRFGD